MAVFLSSLKQSGKLDSLHITVCNVGSRKLGVYDDYASQGWQIFAPNLTIYGFDADPEACDAANADIELRQQNGEVNWTEIHVPVGLGGHIGEAKLYVTKAPMCSSLYPPNEPYLARFEGLPELVNLDFEVDIEVTTLDDFCQVEGVNEIDFLQVDVQGADLDVLKGASWILERSVLAIEIEVEYSHLYSQQPLFADVDMFLRNNGFTLFDLMSSRRNRTNSPIQSKVHPGQLLWGEGFYFRDLIDPNSLSLSKTPAQIFKLACIADVLNFSDYALELFKYLTLNYGDDPQFNFADNIVESLFQFPDLVTRGIANFPLFIEIKDYITKYDISELQSQKATVTNINPVNPVPIFHCYDYLRHNHRRLEHLASLGLTLRGKSVLELGAGIGDHTSFFTDRDCKVVVTEARFDCVEIIKNRFPELEVYQLDMESPDFDETKAFDVVYCYGLLYHLSNPDIAIQFMADHCSEILLLETCVSFGLEDAINLCYESADYPSQAVSGYGCRPTRSWIFKELKKHFDYVYMPITQPNHDEFPVDWDKPSSGDLLTRSVFIASRNQISNPLLLSDIPTQQSRH